MCMYIHIPSSRIMYSLVLRIIIVCMVTSPVLSCSCLQTTFEKKFCRAVNSVRGKVVARFDTCEGTCDPFADQLSGRIVYIARVLENFKDNKIEDNVLFLVTAVNSALCGITLQIDQEYLLNLGAVGRRSETCPDDWYNIGLCDFPPLWESLSRNQMAFVRTNANGGARCEWLYGRARLICRHGGFGWNLVDFGELDWVVRTEMTGLHPSRNATMPWAQE